MNDHDDPLLDALSQALAPLPAEPSEAEIAALRRAVARRFAGARVRPWWQRRAVMLLAAAALCTGTAAAVAGGAVPVPVRILARAVGLPVQSPALVETRAAVGRLRAKLAARDREGVARALEDLRSRLDALNERDRRALGEDTVTLFLEAEAFVTLPAPKVAPPAPRRVAERPREAARSEEDDVELDDPVQPQPLVCTPLEDEDDEETAEPETHDEPLADGDDVRAERDRERAEREAERAEREAEKAQREVEHTVQRTMERVQRKVERAQREAEREAKKAQREAEKAQREAEKAQRNAEHEAEKAQRNAEHEAERGQREAEKAQRDAMDRARNRVHEQTERCEDAEKRTPAVPPPPEADDDDDDD
jgi:hypothetical protein